MHLPEAAPRMGWGDLGGENRPGKTCPSHGGPEGLAGWARPGPSSDSRESLLYPPSHCLAYLLLWGYFA